MDDNDTSRRSEEGRKPEHRPGDWFFVGALTILVITKFFSLSPVWLFATALVLGWAINEVERKRHI